LKIKALDSCIAGCMEFHHLCERIWPGSCWRQWDKLGGLSRVPSLPLLWCFKFYSWAVDILLRESRISFKTKDTTHLPNNRQDWETVRFRPKPEMFPVSGSGAQGSWRLLSLTFPGSWCSLLPNPPYIWSCTFLRAVKYRWCWVSICI
jgi:hypothetical protein